MDKNNKALASELKLQENKLKSIKKHMFQNGTTKFDRAEYKKTETRIYKIMAELKKRKIK